MLSLLIRVAAATAAVGFSAGIFAHRKATKAKEDIKEKFSKTKAEIIHVKVPKGVRLDDCKVAVYVPITDDDQDR